jgi:hypothetical protein
MSDNNGKGADSSIHNEDYAGLTDELEEPVTIKGFAVTYDRTFNLGNYEFLNPAVTIWVKSNILEGEGFDLHHAKERVRRMARNNVRAQLLRAQDKDEVVFLGLQPPLDGREDPVSLDSVSVSLIQKVNLGDLNSITLGFTDWMDVQDVAKSPGELHMVLARMWASLWANIRDEVSRANGDGPTGAFFGLPPIAGEGLTAVLARAVQNGPKRSVPPLSQPNGRFDKPSPGGPLNSVETLSAGTIAAANRRQ